MAGATKRLDAIAEPEPTNGIAPRGYLASARPRYRWVTCELTDGSDDPDGEPFRARIRCNLTWGEIDELNIYKHPDLTYADLWVLMAPHVIEWNALGRDAVTGDLAVIPPPAEAGPGVFEAIDSGLTLWLADQLRTVHLGGEERGKGVTTPGSSAGPPSGAG